MRDAADRSVTPLNEAVCYGCPFTVMRLQNAIALAIGKLWGRASLVDAV